jgi:hypothetical protein
MKKVFQIMNSLEKQLECSKNITKTIFLINKIYIKNKFHEC